MPQSNPRERTMGAIIAPTSPRVDLALAVYREELLDRFAHVAARLERGANTLRAVGGERAVGHSLGLSEGAQLLREAIARVREGAP